MGALVYAYTKFEPEASAVAGKTATNTGEANMSSALMAQGRVCITPLKIKIKGVL